MNHYMGGAPAGAFYLAPGDAVSQIPTVEDTAPSHATVLDGLGPASRPTAD